MEMLEELRVIPAKKQSDDEFIDRIIEENRDVLSRLAR